MANWIGVRAVTNRLATRSWLWLALAITLNWLPRPFALASEQARIHHLDIDIAVESNGAATLSARLTLPSSREYNRIKTNFPEPARLFARWFEGDPKLVLKDIASAYNDQTRSASFTAACPRFAAFESAGWRIDVPIEWTMLHGENGDYIYHSVQLWEPSVVVIMSINLVLPQGSAVDPTPASPAIRYRTTFAALESADNGEAATQPPLVWQLQSRQEISTATMQLACASIRRNGHQAAGGNLWTARTYMQNTGEEPFRNITVQYRIPGYSDWSTATVYPELPAQAMLVDCYYPDLDVQDVAAGIDVAVEVRIRHEGGDGIVEYTGSAPIRLYDNTVFTCSGGGVDGDNTDSAEPWPTRFGSAWQITSAVTPMDPLVRELAGVAAYASGTFEPGRNDKDAMLYITALYGQLTANGIICRDADNFIDTRRGAIGVKYPRQVLRDKSGTSLDIALLMASACESINLPATIYLRPGSALVAVQLPSGRIVPVDPAGMRGTGGISLTFAEAVAEGETVLANLDVWNSIAVAVRSWRQRGVDEIALPYMRPDALRQWGIARRIGSGIGAAEHGLANTNHTGLWLAEIGGGNGGDAGGGGQRQGDPTYVEIHLASGPDSKSSIKFMATGDIVDIADIVVRGDRLEATAQYATTAGNRVVRLIGNRSGNLWEGQYISQTADGRRINAFSFTARRVRDPAAAGSGVSAQPLSTSLDQQSIATPFGLWDGHYTVDGVSHRIGLDLFTNTLRFDGAMRLLDDGLEGAVVAVETEDDGYSAVFRIEGQTADGSPATAVARLRGAIYGDFWLGSFRAELDDSDGPYLECDFVLRRAGSGIPILAEGATGSSDLAGTGESETSSSDTGLTGVWEGGYGQGGGDSKHIRLSMCPEIDRMGQAFMTEDDVVADIVDMETRHGMAAISLLWTAGPEQAKVRAVFSGYLLEDEWLGEFALYLDGSNQPISTGTFHAVRIGLDACGGGGEDVVAE